MNKKFHRYLYPFDALLDFLDSVQS